MEGKKKGGGGINGSEDRIEGGRMGCDQVSSM